MKKILNNKKVIKTMVLILCFFLLALSCVVIAINKSDKNIEIKSSKSSKYAEVKVTDKLIINTSLSKETALEILNNNKISKVDQCIQNVENAYDVVEEQQKEESKENKDNESSNAVEENDSNQNVDQTDNNQNNLPEEDNNQEPTVQKISLGTFKLTAYCSCSKCCLKSDGITASGTKATAGRTIAAPSNFKFGTRVVINGNTYVVEDRGGAIKGNRIDIFLDSHEEALNFGVQYAEVFIYN